MPLSPAELSVKLVAEYQNTFGQPVPQVAFEVTPREVRNKMIEQALKDGKPVAEWGGEPFASRRPSKGSPPAKQHWDEISNVGDQKR